MTDHIASADKKVPTIIDRICEAGERLKDEEGLAEGYYSGIDDFIDEIRRIAAAGATEGEIASAGSAIANVLAVKHGMGLMNDAPSAEAAINAMLGRE